MSNIFQEIDEDVRRERYRSLWNRYGLYVITAVVLIILAVVARTAWGYWQEGRQEESSAVYQQAIEALEEDNTRQTRKQLDISIADMTGGYAVLARFREAAALAGSDPEAEAEAEAAAEAEAEAAAEEAAEMEEGEETAEGEEIVEMEESEETADMEEGEEAVDMEEGEETADMAESDETADMEDVDNIAAAVAIYDSLIADSGITLTLRNLARVRAGLLLLGRENLEVMQSRLEGLAESSAPLNRSALEILAIAAFEAGDYPAAKESYETLSRDPDAPPGMKTRAATMLDIIEPFVDGGDS